MGKVLHQHIWSPNSFGGVTNTTLCRRVRNGGDYNIAENGEAVTCKFCIAMLKENSAMTQRRMTDSKNHNHAA